MSHILLLNAFFHIAQPTHIEFCRTQAPFIILYHAKGWLSTYSSCFELMI